MGWDAVWQLALKQFSAETVEIRLFIILAAAFVLALILVGLKYAFRSAEPKLALPAPAPVLPKRLFAAAPAAASAVVERAAQPSGGRLGAPKEAPGSTRKSVKHTINRQQAMRPRIRRTGLPSLTESRPSLPPASPKR